MRVRKDTLRDMKALARKLHIPLSDLLRHSFEYTIENEEVLEGAVLQATRDRLAD